MKKVIRTERGWAGHFICADQCRFRRNTLLELAEARIVVSTVGDNWYKDKLLSIGPERYFETMAFYAEIFDDKCWDADISKQISFDSDGYLDENADYIGANDMHETVVEEITDKDIMTLERLHDPLYEQGKCSEKLHESYINLLWKLQKIKENERSICSL
jgi:hypothetical protein